MFWPLTLLRRRAHTQGMPIEPTQERLYTITEAAAKLGYTRQRVHQHIQSGALKAYQYGGIWLIPESALDAFQPRKSGGQKRK